MLEIKNLQAKVEDKEILKGLNLTVKAGEIHAIMGPNGSGKSTLSKVLAGHPAYEVTGGEVNYEINFQMKNLLELAPDERAKEGVFLAFQYPIEVPGISNFNFLHTSFNAVLSHQGSEPMSENDFRTYVEEKMKLVSMRKDFLERPVNVGFSGGEKKRAEILQMAVLKPEIAIMDETDSGLDIDALRIVSEGVNTLRGDEMGIVLITHYQRILNYISPDFVHVMLDGRIVESGGADLALHLEDQGYDWVREKYEPVNS